MESPMTTTVISTRLPATPGNISHLGTAASAGRKAFLGFNIIKALMLYEMSSFGYLLAPT